MKFSEIKSKLESGIKIADCGIQINEYIPIGKKYGIAEQAKIIDNNIIKIDNGFATIDRLQYEINLYCALCGLYTNIELEIKDNIILFDDKMLDVLMKYKFKSWLISVTKNDAYDFESIFKNSVFDEIRKLNTHTAAGDVSVLQSLIEQLNNVDPRVLKLIDADNTSVNHLASEMVNSANG